MNRKRFDFSKMQTGLMDRFTGLFAPKDGSKRTEADKLALIEILLYGILILAAVRVIDAVLTVNEGMPLVALWVLAVATLILTEGGFIIWRAFRYKKTANKTQRDIAAVGMLTSFSASLIVGLSDYVGVVVGGNALTLGAISVTGETLMAFAVGAAYAIAIVGHVGCAILVKEFDDQVAADNANNFIDQEAENALRASRLTERRAEVAADGLVRQAGVVSGVLANLSVAPTAATIAAVHRVRRQVAEQYGDFISVQDVDRMLNQVLGDLPALTRHAYTGAVREFVNDPDTIADLGLHPDRVAEAVDRATASMEGMLRGALGPDSPAMLNAPRPNRAPASSPPAPRAPVTPPARPRYDLDSLLDRLGQTRAQARQQLDQMGLNTAPAAYDALVDYLPADMTLAEFAPLYDELMAPLYGPAPVPLQPVPEPVYKSGNGNGNGNGHTPNFH